MSVHVQHVAGRARGELDAATLHMEVDPQNLLEEVEAQLRIGGSWMTESGVRMRCRLAKNQAEVVGALIELERQGRALSKDRDTRLALWRAVQAEGLPTLKTPIAELTVTQFTQPPASAPALPPPVPVATTTPEVSMPRADRSTPILTLLQSGPLAFDQILAKTKFTNEQVSQTLFSLRAKGRIRKNVEKLYELTSGAAVAPRKKVTHAPPRGPSRPTPRVDGTDLRWFLGSDGSVLLGKGNATIELTPEQFDTIRRAHSVIRAATTSEA